MAEIALRQIRAIIAVVRGRLVHPRRRARERHAIRHFPACRRGRTHARRQAVRALRQRREAHAGRPALLQALHRGGEPARQRQRGGARLCRAGQRRPSHRPDPDHDARRARAAARASSRRAIPTCGCTSSRATAAGSPTWCMRGELDFAVVPASEGRVGLKSRLIVRDREMLVSNPELGLHAAAAGAAEGLRAAQDHPARPHQRAPPQHRDLLPDPRRRGRRHDRDGRDDQHAAIRAALRLGGDPVRADLHRRHRPDRSASSARSTTRR